MDRISGLGEDSIFNYIYFLQQLQQTGTLVLIHHCLNFFHLSRYSAFLSSNGYNFTHLFICIIVWKEEAK